MMEVNAVVSDDGNTMTLTHTFGEDKEIPPTEEYTALPASALTGTADSIETQGEKNGNDRLKKQQMVTKLLSGIHSTIHPTM